MSITSSFLYHFTGGKLAAIQGILQTGYRITFSDEVEYYEENDGSIIKERRAIPMVCFCDLPLFEIRSHAEMYSASKTEIFGFGMSRSWAAANRLNPIIYVSPQSYMMGLFNWINNYLQFQTKKGLALDVFHGQNRDVLKDLPGYADFYKLIEEDDYINNPNIVTGVFPTNDNNFDGSHNDLSRFELFYKPTHGIYHRNGKEIPDHPYYYEREWRYMPDKLPRIRCCLETANMDANLQTFKINYDKFIARRLVYGNLSFSADDVDQIIVDTKRSADELVDFIMDNAFTSVCGYPVQGDDEKNNLIGKIKIWEDINGLIH